MWPLMPRGGHGGRKKRARTTAEKLLMAEIRDKFREKMEQEGWSVETAAKELNVSRASFYNYISTKNPDLPGFEVLKRAHDEWGLSFQYIDFGGTRKSKASPSEREQPRQYVLPFVEAVKENDIEVVMAKPVTPDTLQLTINIRFAG